MKKISTLLLALIAVSVFKINTAKAQVNVQDSLALVDLYNSTNGAHWGAKWNLNMPVSTWHGITVYNGRVTVIFLNLDGLVGSIPSSLSNITNLNGLDLSNNVLSGSIPASLGNLLNLNSLNLAINHLTGSIPSSLSNLKNLGFLNLAANDLTGNIPSWLGNLNLNYLSLGSNQFSGKIPSSLSNLINLTYLNLLDNNLTGNIPSWLGNFVNLDYLSLGTNQFSGKIPSSLSNLINLYYLNLAANNLTGNIPSWLDNLTNLNSLFLDHNKLTGSINHKFDSLTNLYDLTLNNNQLTGTVSSSFNNLINLNQLDLSVNQLNGKIPSLNNLTQLYALHFDSNQFTFNGMEDIASTFSFATYANQANISIQQNGNVLSVSAGGTISNNTYNWYKNGVLFKTKKGHPGLSVTAPGNYSVTVTNSIATALTLYSDTVNYPMAPYSITAQVSNENKILRAQVYPNPATTNATVSFYADRKYSITVSDAFGKILQIKNGIAVKGMNSIQLDLSKYASGIYLIRINDELDEKQTLRLDKQ